MKDDFTILMSCSHIFNTKGQTTIIRVRGHYDVEFALEEKLVAIKSSSDIFILIVKGAKNVICVEFVDDTISM